jgi:hypothetical protein
LYGVWAPVPQYLGSLYEADLLPRGTYLTKFFIQLI